jgi:hypothetical protein
VTGIEETSIRALVKLEQVLPSHLRRRVNALSSVLATLPASGPMVDPEALTAIAGACRDCERLRFAYRSREGQDSRRHVEPHSLVNLGRRWYLVAWDCEREGWRTFRVDRLERAAPAGARFTPRTLPGKDPAAFVAANLRTAPSRYEARVTVYAPAAELEQRRYLWGTVEARGEGACEYRTSDDSLAAGGSMRAATGGSPSSSSSIGSSASASRRERAPRRRRTCVSWRRNPGSIPCTKRAVIWRRSRGASPSRSSGITVTSTRSQTTVPSR